MKRSASQLGALPEPFQARPVALQDAPGLTALLNACAIEQYGRPRYQEGELRSELQFPSMHLQSDSQVVVAPDGQFVALALLRDSPPHTRLEALVEVHPHFKGLGLGSALCAWLDQRGRESLAAAAPVERPALVQERLQSDRAAGELLRARGYQIVRRSLHMSIQMAEPPQPDVPAGLAIRPFRRGQEEPAMLAAMQEAFSDHYGFVLRPLKQEIEEFESFMRTAPNFNPQLYFVAVEEGQIAGACFGIPMAGEGPGVAWIYSLCVRRNWRRRGLGLALLQHTMRALFQGGCPKALLAVDAQNLTGATRLYEKAGFRVDHQLDIYEKPLGG